MKHPWLRADVQFHTGASLFREGRIWEAALTIGATAQFSVPLFGGDLQMINQAELWSNTRIPEVGAHVGTVLVRTGVLVGEVGFTIGMKLNTINVGVYVIPWAPATFRALQFFPSFRLHWRKQWFGLDLSLFDAPDTSIGRIGIAIGDFNIGYSFPYGADVSARFAISPKTAIQIKAWANWFDNQFSTGLLVGMVFGQGTTYRF